MVGQTSENSDGITNKFREGGVDAVRPFASRTTYSQKDFWTGKLSRGGKRVTGASSDGKRQTCTFTLDRL